MDMHCPPDPKKSEPDRDQVLDYGHRAGILKPDLARPLARSASCEQRGPSTSTQTDTRGTPAAPQTRIIRVGTNEYTIVAGLAGAFVCGGSHLLSTPLDVLKCRIQVDRAKYPDLGTAFRTTIREEGLRGMSRGWAPTLLGYGSQGFAKFGFYESFKKIISDYVGAEKTYVYKTAVFAAAAGLAESVGDVALAPFEAAKVRTQTVAGAPAGLLPCIREIVRVEGANGLFKGLPALWMRQVPYTVSKFVCFEHAIDAIYGLLGKSKDKCSTGEQLRVSMTAGIVAGVCSAICSHPPDVIVSQLYKNPSATFGSVCAQLGFMGLWAGLATRILMIGSIAACQLFIVDSVKMALHLERPALPPKPASLK